MKRVYVVIGETLANGYAKLERGERQLKIPRLEQIAATLEMELKDFLEVDEKTVFNASFYDQSCCYKSQHNHANSDEEMAQKLETLRLTAEQKEREIELLKEQVNQVNQLKQVIELMKK